MSDIILVGGELHASQSSDDRLITYALGSCIGLVLLDPPTRTIGMVHIALPESSINPKKALSSPGYFADTGIKALLQHMSELGCTASGEGMLAKIAGGAAIMNTSSMFNVGERNIFAIKSALSSLNMRLLASDVAKNHSRTLVADVKSARITVSSPGRSELKL